DAPAGLVGDRLLQAHLPLLEAVLTAAVLAVVLVVVWMVGRGRKGARRPHEPAALGLLTLVWLAAAGLQTIAPEAALVAAWPLAVGVLAALLARRLGRIGWIAAGIAGVIGAGFMLALAHGVFLGVGWTLPEGPAALALFVLAPLAPVLVRAARTWTGPALALLLLIGAGAGVWWLRQGPQPTAERPAVSQVLFVADPDQRDYRIVSPFSTLDDWSRGVLELEGGAVEVADEPALWMTDVRRAAVDPISVVAPVPGVERL